MDKSQGFWVIHSVPLFPPVPEHGYGYPATGEFFGQTAICITFKYDQFAEIGMKSISLRKLLPSLAPTPQLRLLSLRLVLVFQCALLEGCSCPSVSDWETKWDLETASLASVMFIQQFPVSMWEIQSSTLSPSPHEDYWDNNSHEYISRVNSVCACKML